MTEKKAMLKSISQREITRLQVSQKESANFYEYQNHILTLATFLEAPSN